MIKLGFVISHPTLGRVYVVGIHHEYVYMNSLASNQYDDWNERNLFGCYRENLCDFVITFEGYVSDPYGTNKYQFSDNHLESVTQRLIQTLLDESANSNKIIQALKCEGIDLEGHTLKRSYLGNNHWMWTAPDGVSRPITKFISYVESRARHTTATNMDKGTSMGSGASE